MTTDCKRFNELADPTSCNWLVPPNIHFHMTGVRYAKQTRDGMITLTYADNSEQSRISTLDMVREFESFGSIVSFVQASQS